MTASKKPLAANKGPHAHGDVVPATGRVARAEAGYHPRAEASGAATPRKPNAKTTSMKASLAKPSGKR